MRVVLRHGPAAAGLGSKAKLFDMHEALMMAARALHNPESRDFMKQKMEELTNIPNEFLGLIKGGENLVAAKYVMQGPLGIFVTNHMVGAGHDGCGYRATEGEINDFQNDFKFDVEIAREIAGIAIGFGKLSLLIQQMDAQQRRREKDMLEDGRDSGDESEEVREEDEGEEEEVDGKRELQRKGNGSNLSAIWTRARKSVEKDQFDQVGVSNDYVVGTVSGSFGWVVMVTQSGATVPSEAIVWHIGDVSPTTSPKTIAK